MQAISGAFLSCTELLVCPSLALLFVPWRMCASFTPAKPSPFEHQLVANVDSFISEKKWEQWNLHKQSYDGQAAMAAAAAMAPDTIDTMVDHS